MRFTNTYSPCEHLFYTSFQIIFSVVSICFVAVFGSVLWLMCDVVEIDVCVCCVVCRAGRVERDKDSSGQPASPWPVEVICKRVGRENGQRVPCSDVTKVLNINVITNISEMLHVKFLCLASLLVASQMLNKATSYVVQLNSEHITVPWACNRLYQKLNLRTYFNRCVKYVYETGLWYSCIIAAYL